MLKECGKYMSKEEKGHWARMIGDENYFLCMTRNCANNSALVQDIDEIELHPEHKIVKIKTLRDQLNDPNHPMNKFL